MVCRIRFGQVYRRPYLHRSTMFGNDNKIFILSTVETRRLISIWRWFSLIATFIRQACIYGFCQYRKPISSIRIVLGLRRKLVPSEINAIRFWLAFGFKQTKKNPLPQSSSKHKRLYIYVSCIVYNDRQKVGTKIVRRMQIGHVKRDGGRPEIWIELTNNGT